MHITETTPSTPARAALVTTFVELIMAERYSRLSVRQVCAAAKVGRSTFYMHFHNLDHLLMTAIAPQIDDLAVGLTNPAMQTRAGAVVDHLWDQRRLSELWRDALFCGLFEKSLAQAFVRLVPGAGPQQAQFCAAGVTGMLRHWIGGQITAQPEDLTKTLGEFCAAIMPDSARA